MFNISEIIVAPCTIMLLTNQDISDKRWTATTRRRYKRSSHDGSTARADSFTLHVHTRTHAHSASRVSFFSPLRSVGRRSGRGPL